MPTKNSVQRVLYLPADLSAYTDSMNIFFNNLQSMGGYTNTPCYLIASDGTLVMHSRIELTLDATQDASLVGQLHGVAQVLGKTDIKTHKADIVEGH